MFSLRDCAQKAGVKESTARFYKNTFFEFFKTYGTGSHVTYDPEVVHVLSFISKKFSEGLTREEVRTELREKFGIPVNQDKESLVDITQYQKEFASLITDEVRNQVGKDLTTFLNAIEQKFDEKYSGIIKDQQEKIENQSKQVAEQSKQINDLLYQVEHLKSELQNTNDLIDSSKSNLLKLRQDIELRDNEIMTYIREKQGLSHKSLFKRIKEKLRLNKDEQEGVSKGTQNTIDERNTDHNNN